MGGGGIVFLAAARRSRYKGGFGADYTRLTLNPGFVGGSTPSSPRDAFSETRRILPSRGMSEVQRGSGAARRIGRSRFPARVRSATCFPCFHLACPATSTFRRPTSLFLPVFWGVTSLFPRDAFLKSRRILPSRGIWGV